MSAEYSVHETLVIDPLPERVEYLIRHTQPADRWGCTRKGRH